MAQPAPMQDDPSCPVKGMYRLLDLITEHLTEQRILRNSSSPMTLSSLVERRCTISTYYHERRLILRLSTR
jgi:hypothetical protein